MTEATTETIPVLTAVPAETPAELTISIHKIDESFHQHFATDYWAWRAVFENDRNSRVTQHPDLLLTELSFSRDAEHHPPKLITCLQKSKTVGAAVLIPKSIAGEKKFGPAWDLRGYRLAGNRLIGSDDSEVQSRLMQGISQHMTQSRADFLLVEDVETTDPLLSLVENNSHGLQTFKPAPFQRRHMIELPETHDEYWSKFNSKTRSTLQRKLKQFGNCRLELINKPFQIPGFLENAQEISKRSWQSDLLGLRIQNDEFETQVFTFLASQNSLRAYLLWQDNTPISFCIGTQYNGIFNYEEVGYDRDYSKKSPGQVLVIKMLEEMYEHDKPAVFDFGGGDAEYKRQFGTSISESGHVWLLRPGIRSKMIVGYLSGRHALSQTLRGTLAKFGLLDRLRKLSRRGLK